MKNQHHLAMYLAMMLTDGIKNINTLVTGASQVAGKSTTILALEVILLIQEAACFLFVGDPHGTFGEAVAGHVLELGRDENLIILDLSRNVFGSPGLMFRSTATDAFERDRENRAFARAAAEAFSLHRGGSIDDTRVIKEWVFACLRAWQDSPGLEERKLLYFLQPWTPEFDIQVRALPDGEVKIKLVGLKSLWRSAAVFQATVGPAVRLLEETFAEPVFREMLTPTFDIEELVRNKGVLVVLGGPEEFLNRLIIRLINFRLSSLAKANWFATHEPLYMRIYYDEASRMVGETEADDAGKTLKMGKSHCFISQTNDFGDPLVNVRIQENFSEKIMMHTGSEEVAKSNAGHLKLNLDPYKVHHKTERLVHDGYEEISTTSHGESLDAHGQKRKDTRSGKSSRARYKQVADEHYQPLNDQETLNAVSFMELGTGEMFIRRGTKLFGSMYVLKLDIPFQFPGAAEDAIDELIQRHVTQGILHPPTAPPSWTPPATGPAPKKPRPKKQKAPRLK